MHTTRVVTSIPTSALCLVHSELPSCARLSHVVRMASWGDTTRLGVAGSWMGSGFHIYTHSYNSTHDQSSDAASVAERGSNLAPPPVVLPMSLTFL